MDFPAAGFAVASFVNPDLPQPPSTTNPIFTPEANSPTPSAIEDSSFEEEIFNASINSFTNCNARTRFFTR